MKANITKGDWEALQQGVGIQSEEGGHEVHALIGEQFVLVATCDEGYYSTHYTDNFTGKREAEYHLSSKEALANAMAIAALPALIEALIQCEQRLISGLPLHKEAVPGLHKQVVAALKKAGVKL